MKVNTIGNKLPHAWVVSPNDKGRRKIYSDEKIFLDDGEQFEIELYNPTQNNVVALINLDGKPISEKGLLVKSGERIYLDCFIDEKKKFIFNTYEVSSDEELIGSISNNGLLEVNFFNEKIIELGNLSQIRDSINHYYPYDNRYRPNYQDKFWYGSPYSNISNNSNLAYNPSNGMLNNSISLTNENHTIETGQISKGDNSSQKFNEQDINVETKYVSRVLYKLLPNSRKLLTSDDVYNKNINKISDRLAESVDINELISRLYTFMDLSMQKLIKIEEFDIIKSKTIKAIIEISKGIRIDIDELAHYISNLGDLMSNKTITIEEFETIKTNLFNGIK